MNVHRLLAFCGVLAPFSYFIAVFVAGLFYPGYNHVTQLVSELFAQGAPSASVAVQSIIGAGLTGLFILLFALGCYLGIRVSNRSKTIFTFLLGIVGVVFILQGIFHCDAGCITTSTTGAIHVQLGTLAGFALVFAMAFAAVVFRRDKSWKPIYWKYSLVSMALLLVIFFVLGNLSGTWRGLNQLIGSLVYFLWLEIVAIRLFTLE